MDGKEETSLRKVFKILYVGPKRNSQVEETRGEKIRPMVFITII